jgi:hypothetical protein
MSCHDLPAGGRFMSCTFAVSGSMVSGSCSKRYSRRGCRSPTPNASPWGQRCVKLSQHKSQDVGIPITSG